MAMSTQQLTSEQLEHTLCIDCGGPLSEYNLQHGHKKCQTCAHNKVDQATTKVICTVPGQDGKPCGWVLKSYNGRMPRMCLRHEALERIAQAGEYIDYLQERNIEVNPDLESSLAEAEMNFDMGNFGRAVTSMLTFQRRKYELRQEYSAGRLAERIAQAFERTELGSINDLPEDARKAYDDAMAEAVVGGNFQNGYAALDLFYDTMRERKRIEYNRQDRLNYSQSRNGAFGRGGIGPKPEDISRREQRRERDRRTRNSMKNGGGRGN